MSENVKRRNILVPHYIYCTYQIANLNDNKFCSYSNLSVTKMNSNACVFCMRMNITLYKPVSNHLLYKKFVSLDAHSLIYPGLW